MFRKIVKGFVAASFAATAMVGVASPAYANDECSGVYEVDGCEYCSYRNGSAAQPASNCDNGWNDYDWSGCGLYVAGNCVQGNFIAQIIDRP